MKTKSVIKNFFMFALPNVFWIFFVIFTICSKTGVELFSNIGVLFTLFGDLWFANLILAPFMIVLCIILLGFIAIFGVLVFPVLYLADGQDPYMIVCFLAVLVFWCTGVGAFKFKFGKFLEDSSYVSGSHYEITFDRNGKGTAKEVTEYSGGGEFILNFFLLVIRFLVIAIAGISIFVAKIKQAKQ